MANANFAGFWIGHNNVFQFHDFRAAVGVNANGFTHVWGGSCEQRAGGVGSFKGIGIGFAQNVFLE